MQMEDTAGTNRRGRRAAMSPIAEAQEGELQNHVRVKGVALLH